MLVAFDTNIFIYMLGQDDEFSLAARNALRPVLNGDTNGVLSNVVITEILAGMPLGSSVDFLDHPNLTVADVTTEIAARAGSLRATHPSLKTVDAIHLATALSYHCEQFVTNDKTLTKLSVGLPVVPLEDFIPKEY